MSVVLLGLTIGVVGAIIGVAVGIVLGDWIADRDLKRDRRAHLDYLRDLVNMLHDRNGKDTPLSRALAKRYHERKIKFGMEDHA